MARADYRTEEHGLERFARRAQKVLEDWFPGEIEIAGVVYPCSLGSYFRGASYRNAPGDELSGGEVLTKRADVRVRKSFLPRKPAIGTRCKVNGERFMMGPVSSLAPDSAWHITLEDPDNPEA